jgi:predicted O-methyltransferase YrrM
MMNAGIVTAAKAVKYVLPHGIVQQVMRSSAVKRRIIAAHNTHQASIAQSREQYSYKASIAFHSARGLPHGHLVHGSIPEATLDFCTRSLDELIPGDSPHIGLHVGNFLGVSLAHFTNYVRQRNAQSVTISIDPNIKHQTVDSPQNHTIALLTHFGLQKNAIICVGYSMNKTLSNDGIAFPSHDGTEYDPYANHRNEQSCENVLSNLSVLYAGRFDFAVIDGNHEGEHLRRELKIVGDLLKPDGVLILDDVSDKWEEIQGEYDSLRHDGSWRPVGADGRVGILQRSTTMESA